MKNATPLLPEIKSQLPSWASNLELNVPNALLEDKVGLFYKSLEQLSQKDREELLRLMREFAAFTSLPPTQSKLPISYHCIPPTIRMILANILGRVQKRRSHVWASYPKFPIDLSVDILADVLFSKSRSKIKPTPILLSHDIDSPEGLENLDLLFLPLEAKYGVQSTNFIVPMSWKIRDEILERLKNKGHEIGVHGYDHSGKTAFLSEAEILERLESCSGFIKKWDVMGYRSPSLLRTRELLRNLGNLYKYDSSIPTSGGLFPCPNNGCASARPFEVEGMFEIPLSLPRDGSLRFLGFSPVEILQTWINTTELIHRSGGVVVFLNHCEKRFSGNPAMLAIYESYLQKFSADSNYQFMTHRDFYFQNQLTH